MIRTHRLFLCLLFLGAWFPGFAGSAVWLRLFGVAIAIGRAPSSLFRRALRPGFGIYAGLLCSLLAVSETAAGAAPAKPNILFILADDLGWEDLPSYGNPHHRTPHLDQLAAEGMRFTAAYAAPTCLPSRACLLTGKAPARLGITDFISGKLGGPVNVVCPR